METVSELIDKLITVNVKLFKLLDNTADLDNKEKKSKEDIDMIVKLSGDNIRLARQRSLLKSEIDKKINEAVSNGNTDILDEVKSYNR
jgi:hypothetical protein